MYADVGSSAAATLMQQAPMFPGTSQTASAFQISYGDPIFFNVAETVPPPLIQQAFLIRATLPNANALQSTHGTRILFYVSGTALKTLIQQANFYPATTPTRHGANAIPDLCGTLTLNGVSGIALLTPYHHRLTIQFLLTNVCAYLASFGTLRALYAPLTVPQFNTPPPILPRTLLNVSVSPTSPGSQMPPSVPVIAKTHQILS
jgi:hypothetical protein